MPDLPQTINLPTETKSWSPELLRNWTLMIQTLNALSRVDTTANKPTTPDLDHILFTESDSEQHTFVAVSGAWQGVRPTLRIVATASLPAAGASMNGTILIENVAAGDQNLVFYANSERYRVDGGTAF
mgnify:CR=1 FL=1